MGKFLFLFFAGFFLLFLLVLWIAVNYVKSNEVYQASLAVVQQDARVQDLLGGPVEPGLLATMSKVSNPKGEWLKLNYGISGPNGDGEVDVFAFNQDGVWAILRLTVNIGDPPTTLELVSLGGRRE